MTQKWLSDLPVKKVTQKWLKMWLFSQGKVTFWVTFESLFFLPEGQKSLLSHFSGHFNYLWLGTRGVTILALWTSLRLLKPAIPTTIYRSLPGPLGPKSQKSLKNCLVGGVQMDDAQNRRKRTSTHEWAHEWPHECIHEWPHESAHEPPREHPRGLISLFSALQGLPTKHPTKVSTDGRGSPVLFSPVLFLDQQKSPRKHPRK